MFRCRPWGLAIPAIGLTLTTWTAFGLSPDELGILYRRNDPASEQVASRYQVARHVPAENVVAIGIPDQPVIEPGQFEALRVSALARLPSRVRVLALVWTLPYAVGCMSITTAFAAGYRAGFCEPGCGRTLLSPLYDASTLDSARRSGWMPAMLLPSADEPLAIDLIARGARSDGTRPTATVYLVSTEDAARNVRAGSYLDAERNYGRTISIRQLHTPITQNISNVFTYFTGAARVMEIDQLRFIPGAVADHLTSMGGILNQTAQTTALHWIRAGATGSYGTVTEPCNHVGKFPSPMVFLAHYLNGETLIEAYWKAVAMPGQGLFVGEPLAAPFAGRN